MKKPTPKTIAAFEAQFEIDSPAEVVKRVVEEDWHRSKQDNTIPAVRFSSKWKAWCHGPVGEAYYQEMHKQDPRWGYVTSPDPETPSHQEKQQ